MNSVPRNHPAINAVLTRIGRHCGRIYDLLPESRAEIRQLFDELAQITPQLDAADYAQQMKEHWRK
ncbi:MAG TPA: hypothetical protein VNX60_05065 [Candidatus Acidoferrum sp.]|nr:hypothetical protein [Candidatus Acidoferrum sp.]